VKGHCEGVHECSFEKFECGGEHGDHFRAIIEGSKDNFDVFDGVVEHEGQIAVSEDVDASSVLVVGFV
jgi:ribosomal protein L19